MRSFSLDDCERFRGGTTLAQPQTLAVSASQNNWVICCAAASNPYVSTSSALATAVLPKHSTDQSGPRSLSHDDLPDKAM
jgi:hypothetical protein